MKKSTMGITLVALVITVIILLILAGVAISAVVGQEGIFSKAKKSAEMYNNAAENEAVSINQLLENAENAKLDKLAPKEFNVIATDIKKTSFTISAKTEDSEATEDNKMSGIKEYIYFIKKEADSDYISEIVTADSKIYNGLVAGTKYNIYVKAVDKAGNSTSSPVLTITTLQDLIFTREYLQTGSIYGNVTYTTGNLNNSAGLKVLGTSSNPVGSPANLSLYLRWYRDIDLTNYSKLTFYVKKVVDHGSIIVSIDNSTKYYNYYSTLPTTWTFVQVDVSSYIGVHKLVIYRRIL